jgi:hypothetical protein
MKRAALVIAAVLVTGTWVMAAGTGQRRKTATASGDLYIWLSEAGTATCIGGQPTGTFPPCSPDTKRIIWRHFIGTITPASATGPAAVYFTGAFVGPGNCILNAQLRGHCWGTFEGPAAGGGKWEGIWYGTIDFLAFGGDLAFVGHGRGSPEMEGLLLKMESASPGTGNPYDPMPFTARVQHIY